uniref:TPR_REGION domain-containing protein n=1 Tax=Macrostomum lignano TaxID=282301 RepID=A0A1I8JLH0_9PLAT
MAALAMNPLNQSMGALGGGGGGGQFSPLTLFECTITNATMLVDTMPVRDLLAAFRIVSQLGAHVAEVLEPQVGRLADSADDGHQGQPAGAASSSASLQQRPQPPQQPQQPPPPQPPPQSRPMKREFFDDEDDEEPPDADFCGAGPLGTGGSSSFFYDEASVSSGAAGAARERQDDPAWGILRRAYRLLKEETGSNLFDFALPYSARVNLEAANRVIEKARSMAPDSVSPSHLTAWTKFANNYLSNYYNKTLKANFWRRRKSSSVGVLFKLNRRQKAYESIRDSLDSSERERHERVLTRDYTSSDEEDSTGPSGSLRVRQLAWESEELRRMKRSLDEVYRTRLADDRQRAEMDRLRRDGDGDGQLGADEEGGVGGSGIFSARGPPSDCPDWASRPSEGFGAIGCRLGGAAPCAGHCIKGATDNGSRLPATYTESQFPTKALSAIFQTIQLLVLWVRWRAPVVVGVICLLGRIQPPHLVTPTFWAPQGSPRAQHGAQRWLIQRFLVGFELSRCGGRGQFGGWRALLYWFLIGGGLWDVNWLGWMVCRRQCYFGGNRHRREPVSQRPSDIHFLFFLRIGVGEPLRCFRGSRRWANWWSARSGRRLAGSCLRHLGLILGRRGTERIAMGPVYRGPAWLGVHRGDVEHGLGRLGHHLPGAGERLVKLRNLPFFQMRVGQEHNVTDVQAAALLRSARLVLNSGLELFLDICARLIEIRRQTGRVGSMPGSGLSWLESDVQGQSSLLPVHCGEALARLCGLDRKQHSQAAHISAIRRCRPGRQNRWRKRSSTFLRPKCPARGSSCSNRNTFWSKLSGNTIFFLAATPSTSILSTPSSTLSKPQKGATRRTKGGHNSVPAGGAFSAPSPSRRMIQAKAGSFLCASMSSALLRRSRCSSRRLFVSTRKVRKSSSSSPGARLRYYRASGQLYRFFGPVDEANSDPPVYGLVQRATDRDLREGFHLLVTSHESGHIGELSLRQELNSHISRHPGLGHIGKLRFQINLVRRPATHGPLEGAEQAGREAEVTLLGLLLQRLVEAVSGHGAPHTYATFHQHVTQLRIGAKPPRLADDDILLFALSGSSYVRLISNYCIWRLVGLITSGCGHCGCGGGNCWGVSGRGWLTRGVCAHSFYDPISTRP